MTDVHCHRLIRVCEARFYRLLRAGDPAWVGALGELSAAWDRYAATW